MRLKSIALVMGLLLSQHATAGYLFWQVGETTGSDGTYTTSLGSSGSITYSYASIASLDSEPSHNPPTTAGTALNNKVGSLTGEYTKIDGEVAMLSTTVAAVVGDYSDFTTKYFFIELFDANDTLVGTSTAVRGSELSQFYSTAGFNAQWSGAAWNGGTYTAVPEPTSGLMLLIGAAMLGLRRKKVA